MNRNIRALIIGIVLSLIAIQAETLDYPHSYINNIGCESCHFVFGEEPSLLPEWTVHVQQDIDDTQYNVLCWGCHNDVDAPYMRTHSSLQIDGSYGDWTVECRTCHNPHTQKQFRVYGYESYLYSGISTDIQINQPVSGESQITKTGAVWTANEFQGLVVMPNTSEKKYGYKILSNTTDTLTIEGIIDLSKVTPTVDTFAIIYGKLINSKIKMDELVPPKTGEKMPKFFSPTGTNSFADGDTEYDGICEVCHTMTNHFRNYDPVPPPPGYDALHENMGFPVQTETKCTLCHQHIDGFRGMGGGAHQTHVTDKNGPQLDCTVCHGANVPPLMGDGVDLASTTLCDNCHIGTVGSDPAAIASAKNYWNEELDTWVSTEGDEDFCGSCHDLTPGNSQQDGLGNNAPNISGDESTYGFFITGHGRPMASGSFENLSWQEETPGVGNPAANRSCSDCHDLTVQHFNSTNKRLKAGYENDANNSNCQQCHYSGGSAYNGPEWYTSYAAFQSSAHSSLKCSDCHDVHGMSGPYIAMAKGLIKVDSPTNASNFCYQCHTDPGSGGVENLAVSGPVFNNDIEEAFNEQVKHDLGTTFTINSKTYSLQCDSCHNVHIVTGKYWEADQGKSPVSRFADYTEVWGDGAGEKMDDFAGTGKYQTPGAFVNQFNGAQMPDYVTFCLDCHSYDLGSIKGKDWDFDPHGKKKAGTSGLGSEYTRSYTCPNGGVICGRAIGWGSDNCSNTEDLCWPVIPQGAGYVGFVKGGYEAAQRNAGVNYVLSCTDCHEAHGSENYYALMRKVLNTSNTGEEVPLSYIPGEWGFEGGGGGFCLSCHGGWQLSTEHMFWHNQLGGCSACNSASHPNHLDHGGSGAPGGPYNGIGAFTCTGACHTTRNSDGSLNRGWGSGQSTYAQSWHIEATFHGNRKSWESQSNVDTADNSNDLVLDYRFENNLYDSHMWNMHGHWIDGENGSLGFKQLRDNRQYIKTDRDEIQHEY
jgi:hypothetical protein